MARLLRAALAGALGLAGTAGAQQNDGTDVRVAAHVYKPAKVAATPERIAALQLPKGFEVTVFADGLLNPRMLAVAPHGTLYVSRREQGDVLMFKDADRDGRADGGPVAVLHRPGAHGLAIHDGRLYVATSREVFVAPIQTDGTLGAAEMIIGDLPDTGQHPNRTLAFGPDGMLYISAGSTCNACNEANPESAALLRASPDGRSRTIFATGLRNTIGFAWHPQTGELWGLDHGIDYLGDDEQPEELNRIELGKRYGWPHVWGEGGLNPQSTPPGGLTKAQWKAISTPMALGYTAHAAPMQMLFYTGQMFPAEYGGDAFAAMRGSWNRKPASGYEVVRVVYRDGQPQRIEPFVSGFLSRDGRTHFARPVGLAMAADGALLMADDGNGMIYRVAYTGRERGAVERAAPPADAMRVQAARGVGVPLAMARPETRTERTLQVTSRAFADGAPIPQRHSEYADGVSLPLAWTAVPEARSYVIVMEDPDARPITPFVHWVAWNIPAGTTSLPEGLHEIERLTAPDGLMQGRTSRGAPGYFGPRPPVGDPPHRYHIQVLALDRELDLPAGSDRDAVLAAARGHVIAKGELVGTYAQSIEPPR